MSAAVLPSEIGTLATARSLASLRAEAGVRVGFAASSAGTSVATLAERDGYRLKFPRTHSRRAEGVIINTGGGVVGGDRVSIEVSAGEAAEAVVTTQAAERIYRSMGPPSQIDVRLSVSQGARLLWLPQETILFSGARLQRRFTADLAKDACLLVVETLVFGRMASGEIMRGGSLLDHWRVTRGGRLAFAEATRLDDMQAQALMRPTVLAEACAVTVLLYVAADAESRLARVRECLQDARCALGASAWNGMLVVRALAESAEAPRADLRAVIEMLSGGPLPRVWST